MKTTTIGQIARQVSRDLRKNPTEAEKRLWDSLKNRQLLDLRFLRQHPIFYQFDNKKSFFVADFYCHELRLVIELDGPIHEKQKDYDQIRTEVLEFKNILLVRLTNEEILSDLEKSIGKLKITINRRQIELGKGKPS